MGGVADFVSDVAGGVVDAVGDAVEWVGDTVGNIVENALDDPVKTAFQIAAIAAAPATGGASLTYGLPAIEAIDTLEEGGSVEDALKGAALTFATQQAVSFGMDAFGAPGVDPSVGQSSEFFSNGSTADFFADGSSIFTDAGGAASFTPAPGSFQAALPEFGVQTAASTAPFSAVPGSFAAAVGGAGAPGIEGIAAPGVEDIAQAGMEVAPVPGTEVFPIDMGVTPEITAIPPTGIPEVVAAQGAAQAAPQFDTMEDLLRSIGEMPPDAAFVPPDMGAPIEFPSDVTPGAGAGMPEPTFMESLGNLGSAAGESIYDFATENPLTTLGIGAAVTGALSQPEIPEIPGSPEEVKRTFDYQPAAQIGATKGLEELWSAAQSIYGDRLESMLGISPPPFAASLPQQSFQQQMSSPFLGEQAAGLKSLVPRSYTPVGAGQTFDISTLTPEQIVQLQNLVQRRRSF